MSRLRESIRVVGGRLPLLPYHLERLAEGGTSAEVRARVAQDAARLAEEAPHGAVKLHVLVDPAEAAFALDVDTRPSSLDVPGGPAIEPVVVHALPPLSPCAVKPADRSYWDGPQHLARLRGADQAILVTAEGLVVDGGSATVFAVLGRTLVTPPAPPAIAGVACRVVLREFASPLGLGVEIRPLPLDELLGADEVLLSNAVGGIVAARGRGGPVAGMLAEAWRERLPLPSAEG